MVRVTSELQIPKSGHREYYDTSQDEGLFRHCHAQAPQACCRHLRYSRNEFLKPTKTCSKITHFS